MPNYTPGPWEYDEETELVTAPVGKLFSTVCRVYDTKYVINANLIAAAPDLLEAAEELCLGLVDADQHVDEDGNTLSDFLQLREAIARAKGEID